ncbi:MAG: hypothetical protein GKS06_13400 [Acidobacteria bacterium]|nr:hypothetical protein [Acidobacteriota bacterium]
MPQLRMNAGSNDRPRQTRGLVSGGADDGRRRYRYGFVARYLKPLVFDLMMVRDIRQYEVARWLGIPDHALSEYLTARSHPSAERQQDLERIGAELRRLKRAMLADKIQYWIDNMAFEIEDVYGALRRIETETARADGSEASEDGPVR